MCQNDTLYRIKDEDVLRMFDGFIAITSAFVCIHDHSSVFVVFSANLSQFKRDWTESIHSIVNLRDDTVLGVISRTLCTIQWADNNYTAKVNNDSFTI